MGPRAASEELVFDCWVWSSRMKPLNRTLERADERCLVIWRCEALPGSKFVVVIPLVTNAG